MTEDNFGKPVIPSDNVEKTDQGANSPVVNPDPSADKIPEAAVLIPETPMGGTVDPLAGTFVPEAPMDKPAIPEALLDHEESEHLRTRWNEIQGMFVDDPRSAVQQADALVSEVVEKITLMFASEHGSLEGQWNQGINVSTEDLRKALQHYRSFFNRLVV